MATFRRRSVKFADRPPQVVRYSYHAGSDASTSLRFSEAAVGRMPMPADLVEQQPPAPHITPSLLTTRKYYEWSPNPGNERIDVVSEPSGITRVVVGGDSTEELSLHGSDDGYCGLEDGNLRIKDKDRDMTKHLFDCVDQFNTACDRILNARRMIDGDKMLTEEDKQYLFGLVNKAIFNGKNRLATAVDSLPQQTQLPNHLVGSQQAASRTISSTGSNASSLSAATGAQPQPSPLTIDASFINRYGPQLIQALQANMAKQN